MASLTDAEEALRSTSAKANFQRLTRLLMCGGLTLLRETFDSIHSPADLPVRLGDPTIQTQLRGARLTQPERNCLNPSSGVYGKSTDFDITLIFKLLRTICNLTPPPGPRGWDDLPNSSDHSLEADLVRIKYYRNEVYAHSKTMEITDTEFNDLWGKISKALIRIAAAISHEKKDEWKKSIDGFFLDALTPEEGIYIEELNTWYKQDMDIKSEVENLKEEMSDVKDKLEDQKKMHEKSQQQVELLLKMTAESIAQAGSPIISNQPSGRPWIPHEPLLDQERTENDVSHSEELQPNSLDSAAEIQVWRVIMSCEDSFELFFKYLAYKLDLFVPKHDLGSLLVTVECSSLPILERLWEDYRTGHLNAIAQEILVTAEVLKELGLADVRLKTFISEEEYEKGKQIFIYHSAISGQSRLPPGDAAGKSASQVEAAKDAVSEFPPGDVPGELTTPIQKGKDTGDDSDYLERMSILEEENRELKRRMVAIEDKLKGKDMRIMKLENERQLFDIELSDIKREIHSMEVAMAQKRDLDVPVSPIAAGRAPLSFLRMPRIEAESVTSRQSRLTLGDAAAIRASEAEAAKYTVSKFVPGDILDEGIAPIEKGLKDIGDDSGQGSLTRLRRSQSQLRNEKGNPLAPRVLQDPFEERSNLQTKIVETEEKTLIGQPFRSSLNEDFHLSVTLCVVCILLLILYCWFVLYIDKK